MKSVFALLIVFTRVSSISNSTMDFGDEYGDQWYVVNNTVMGGRSNSSIQLQDNSLIFSGTVSLENNGGFASIRSGQLDFSLENYAAVTINYRKNARPVEFMMEVSRQWWRPNYQIALPVSDHWNTFTIPLNEIKEVRIGQKIGNTLDAIQQAKVFQIGFILADKQTGPFQFEVDYIKFH